MSSELVGQVILIVGVGFNLFGCIGLVRLPDIYNRVQASTKCVTLGTSLMLAGAAVWSGQGALAMKAVLCLIFVLTTSPVAAHALARGAYLSGVPPFEGTVVDEYGAYAAKKRRELAGEEVGQDAQA